MARNKAIEERVQALVAEMLADEEAQGLNAENENINDIEEGMVRIGDMVAREFGQRKLAAHMSRPPQDPRCPDCGQAGERQGGANSQPNHSPRRGSPDGSQVSLA